MKCCTFAFAVSIGAVAFAPSVPARVARIDITSTVPAHAIPGALPYEVITGTFTGELDPNDPHNRIITDISLAPRNSKGRVEYSATFELARPVDMTHASGVLFYNVPNRGNGSATTDVDGHIRVVSGWQGDLPSSKSLQRIEVPVAHYGGGATITSPFVTRMINLPAKGASAPIRGGFTQTSPLPIPASLDTAKAKLTVTARGGRPRKIAAADWAFADCTSVPFPGTPDPGKFCVRGGFEAESEYILAYRAKDPKVLGIGLAATRDLVTWLRSGKPDDAGNANPAGQAVRWTVASGTSQSGNFLRTFVHLGFNTPESGGRVFDGINPDIAARLIALNIRFGLPGGAADGFEPGSEGTVWWGRYRDNRRHGPTTSLLDRCTADMNCPKVIETIGSSEFWGLRASPDFVGTDARADIPLPANVRRYYFPGVTHGGAFAQGNSFNANSRVGTICILSANPNPTAATLRAAQHALVEWVVHGTEPPNSRYPTIANGDLVAPTAAAMNWPRIPGAPTPDAALNPFVDQDFGHTFRRYDLSGIISKAPPSVRGNLPSRVPRVNADGNEFSGVSSVQLQVPLGTYTGWNIQKGGFAKGTGCGFIGGFIPFARTRAERIASGDPRQSLEERYGDHAGFVASVNRAIDAQLAAGFLLPADAEILRRDADQSTVLR